MKFISTLILTPLLLTAPLAFAFVAEMFPEANCGGASLGERNVWDDSCAYVNPGFASFRLKANSGSMQQGTLYGNQACAAPHVWQGCMGGVNALKVGECVTMSGQAHAMSSYWSPAPCPG
ncbi:uncharacterized protein AB675_9911 [Cyphellophora attinorum]|uniref:Uncharacterized protein n=1 Tax=Cyphellophora attinorum TaxID=1664694 RepID=A0A0N0NID8_9EURO|nr:uncharacterized protein AB675_9911 [Phialophora attinorum]KPI35319.1 hypothetical protein AB675_9911 [Phialophora attinorum]